MPELRIDRYISDYKEKWDRFVTEDSANGTFLQTMRFLSYHGERLKDASLMITKGNGTLVAVVPACERYEDGRKIFDSHYGSTFGGIVVSRDFYDIEHLDAVTDALDSYLADNHYDESRLRCTSDIFAKEKGELLYYFLFLKGYAAYDQLSCYIDFARYNDDVVSNFTSGKRRDYKYSLKNGLTFRRLDKDSEVRDFYGILCGNLQKFDAKPVHSLEELLEFKNERLKDVTAFYGVFYEERMIAGSMVFLFEKRVFHTQYLAADQGCMKLYPMNFLDTHLIQTAKDNGFAYFSFGTSTEKRGMVLNKRLAEFKEGFGTGYGINKVHVKFLKQPKTGQPEM